MAPPRPKKSGPVGVRFSSEEQHARFLEACTGSNVAPQDALRMAAQAMIIAYQRFGRIPRDMEIRQAQIGDTGDMQDLLRRAVAIMEENGGYQQRMGDTDLIAADAAATPAGEATPVVPAAPSALAKKVSGQAGAGERLAQRHLQGREAEGSHSKKTAGKARA